MACVIVPKNPRTGHLVVVGGRVFMESLIPHLAGVLPEASQRSAQVILPHLNADPSPAESFAYLAGGAASGKRVMTKSPGSVNMRMKNSGICFGNLGGVRRNS